MPELYGLTYLDPKDWVSKYKETNLYVWDHESFTDITDYNKTAIHFVQKNKNARLLVNNSAEGYVYHNLKALHQLTTTFSLQNKVIYCSGNPDVKKEHVEWLEKKKLTKTFEVFYHSFWFSHARQNMFDSELSFSIDKQIWYCCLNNRPHAHRIQTINYLDQLSLMDDGMISSVYHGIDLDGEGSRPHDYNPKIYDNCLINLVTETWYHELWSKKYHNFLSEKTWKPMIAKQIFITIGPRYTLKYLKEIGFKTFSDYIDESYDELDESKRLVAAVDALDTAMKKYTIQELNNLTKDIREYNFNLIKDGIPQIQGKIQSVLCT